MANMLPSCTFNSTKKPHRLYIDIHTHKAPFSLGKSIQSLYSNYEEVAKTGNYSIGIHPWYIDGFHWRNQWNSLVEWSGKEQVLAIGECGLDTVCDTPFSLQEEVFAEQINLAEKLRKPLVIHCVRAWEETLILLEKQPLTIPIIFHGFNKKLPLAERLTGKGYYLSFGKWLQNPVSSNVISAIPRTQILLETDDADITIDSVYDWAAASMGIEINSLSLQIQKNCAAVFGSKLVGI